MVTNIHLPSPRGTFNLVKNKKPLSFLLFGNCFGKILCLNYNINPVVSVHKNCSSLGTRTGFLVGFYYINSLGALKSTDLSRYGSLLCLTWSTVWRLARIKSGLFWKVQENRRSSNGYKLVCRKFGFDIWIFFFHRKRSQDTGSRSYRTRGLHHQQCKDSIWSRFCTTSFNWCCFVQVILESLPAWIILWFCHQHREQWKGDCSIGNFTSV